MLILRRTHDLIVAGLRAQLHDSRDRERFLEERLTASEEAKLKLIDRLLAKEHPIVARLLNPPPQAPAAPRQTSPPEEEPSEPEPTGPGDIELWLREQNVPVRG